MSKPTSAAAFKNEHFCLDSLSDGSFVLSRGGEGPGPILGLSYDDAFALSIQLMEFLCSMPGVPQYVDELGVMAFSLAMMSKLARKRAEGRGGWNDPAQCPAERLASMLIDHLVKGDPVDIGNFAMMLHQRDDAAGVLGNVFQEWLDKITPPTPAANEISLLGEQLGQTKGALGAATNQLADVKRERETLIKELAQTNERRALAERNLSRALGYIDRVTEDEPLTTSAQRENFEPAQRRGPIFEQEPYYPGVNSLR